MLIRKEGPDYVFPFFLNSISKLWLKEKKKKKRLSLQPSDGLEGNVLIINYSACVFTTCFKITCMFYFNNHQEHGCRGSGQGCWWKCDYRALQLEVGLAKLINRKTPSWGMTKFHPGIIRGSKETVWSCFSYQCFEPNLFTCQCREGHALGLEYGIYAVFVA